MLIRPEGSFLTERELSKAARLPRKTIWKLCVRGTIPAFRFNGRSKLFFHEDDVAGWLLTGRAIRVASVRSDR